MTGSRHKGTLVTGALCVACVVIAKHVSTGGPAPLATELLADGNLGVQVTVACRSGQGGGAQELGVLLQLGVEVGREADSDCRPGLIVVYQLVVGPGEGSHRRAGGGESQEEEELVHVARVVCR